MSTYVIVEEPGDWPCHADYLLTARTYLQHGVLTTGYRPRIINLCRNLEHLSAGYYCSAGPGARPPLPAGFAGHQPAAAPAAACQAVAQVAGLAGPAERGPNPGARYLRPVRAERAGGLARYYYGLSQLPLQELTLKRLPRLVGAPAAEPVAAGAEPERESADAAPRPGTGGHRRRGAGGAAHQLAAILVDPNDAAPAAMPWRWIASSRRHRAGDPPRSWRHRPSSGCRSLTPSGCAPRRRSATTPSNLPAAPSSSRCR